MEFIDLRRIVKCYGWIVLLAMLAGGTSAAYFVSKEPILYESIGTVVVGPSDQIGTAETTLRGLDAVSRRNVIATYARIPSTRTVLEGAANDLELSREKSQLYRLRTSVIPDTNILRVSVRGPDPSIAAKFTNASIRRAQQFTPEIYDGIVSFKVLDQAITPTNPIDSGMSRKVGLGVLFGFILSFGLSFLIERFRRRHAYTPEHHPMPSRIDNLASEA